MTRTLAALALAVLTPLACERATPYASLRIVEGPGSDGRALALDQPLRVEFDRPLPAAMRAGAFAILDAAGAPREAASHEVAGRYLMIHPRLPRRPDLSDGTLRPGAHYRLILRGVPHLVAVRSPEGAALIGDRVLEFETLPRDDPAALVGGVPSRDGLRLLLPGGGIPPLAVVGGDGMVELPLSGPLDPRTLLAPARLLQPGGGAVEAPLELAVNSAAGSLLRVHVPQWGPGAVLELPEGLEGPGGVRLSAAMRRIRLRGAP
ncbi:MAG TPA: hypothetical protein VGC54_09090 [Planctomycetota bacterium]